MALFSSAVRSSFRNGGLLPRLFSPTGVALLLMAALSGRIVLFGAIAPFAVAIVLVARATLGDGALLVGAVSLLSMMAGSGSRYLPAAAILLAFPLWGFLRRTRWPVEARLCLAAALLGGISSSVWAHPIRGGEDAAAALALALVLRFLTRAARSGQDLKEAASLGGYFLLLAGATTGLGWPHVPASLALASFGVLLLTYVRSDGAALAPLMGLVLYATGQAPISAIVDLSLGGALAIVFRGPGKWAMALAFLVGDLALAANNLTSVDLVRTVGLDVAGAAFFLFFPMWLLRPVKTVSMAIREDSGPDDRLTQVTLALREMASALVDPSPISDEGRFEEILKTVERRACPGCPHRSLCWKERLPQTARGFQDALARLTPGKAFTPEDIPPEVRRRCPRPKEVALATTLAGEMASTDRAWRVRLRTMGQLLGNEIRGAAGLIDLAVLAGEPVATGPMAVPYATGLARVAKAGQSLSGDGTSVRELPGNRLLVALSDGMGVGAQAFRESSLTLDLVERFLALGASPGQMVEMVNAFLLMRNREESFATLDMAVWDLVTGDVEVAKVGSPPSFLIQGGQVERLVSRTVPIGILIETSPEVFFRHMNFRDTLVFVSDGILESGTDWLESLLRAAPEAEPQYLADGILDAALEKTGGQARDDMTVLVVSAQASDAEGKDPARIGQVPVGKAGTRGGLFPHGR